MRHRQHIVTKYAEDAVITSIQQGDNCIGLSWQEAAKLPGQLGITEPTASEHYEGCGGRLMELVTGADSSIFGVHHASQQEGHPAGTLGDVWRQYYSWTTLKREMRPQSSQSYLSDETKTETISYSIGHVIVLMAACRQHKAMPGSTKK